MNWLSSVKRQLLDSGVNQSIFRAASLVAFAGVLVKIIATFKEFVVAGVYGRSDAMDAFLIAFLIPNLLINLIAESMNQALIPTLVRVRELEGRERAQHLLSSSMLSITLLLGVSTLLLALSAHWLFPLLASHFPPAKLALTEHLFYALLPVVLLTGLATNCTAVLNTLDHFAWPAVAPIVMPLAIMLAAFFFGTHLGIWAIVYATVAGSALHAILMAWMMHSRGYKFRLHWHGSNQATREVAQQYGPVLLSGLVASGGLLVDQSMAALLPSGSVSALVYAGRFVSVLLTLLAGAVSTAVVPYFSRIIAHRDWPACRTTMRTWVTITALVSIPLTLLLMAIAHPLIRLAFQHGVFKAADTAIVSPIMIMYAIQIPFYVVSRVFYRFIVAMRRTDLVFYCGLINLVLDIILNIILMRLMGIAGIALATSLWMVTTFALLFYWARMLLRRAALNTPPIQPSEVLV
jgi:putative peptidoglycan lipid II flippase